MENTVRQRRKGMTVQQIHGALAARRKLFRSIGLAPPRLGSFP